MVPKGWDKKKLSDMALINPTKTKKINNDDYVTFFAMSDISEEGRVLNYNIRKYKEVCVGYTPFEDGDILIAKITPCFENGKGTLVTNLKNGVGFGSTEFHVLRPLKDKTYPKFLFQFTKSRFFRRLGEVNMVGTAGQKRVPTNFLTSTKFIFPPLPEQRKISVLLSTWDKALENTTKLLDAKKKHKHGLIQQLVTGKKRFKKFMGTPAKRETPYGEIPKDWEYPLLKEIAEEVTERNINGREITVLSCTKYDGLVSSQEYFRKRVFSKDTSDYKIVKRSQFAYATNHIEEGSIGLLENFEEGLVSPMYTVFKTRPDVHPPFLFKLFKTELYRHIFEVNTSASVDRRGSLRWKQFSSIHVPLPSFGEQVKISDYIELHDKEIFLMQKQLELLNSQKTGLMQKLLTGQIRVKV